MVWVVSRFRLKKPHLRGAINQSKNDWIHDRDLLAGGDLTKTVSQPAHQPIEYPVLWLLITEEKKNWYVSYYTDRRRYAHVYRLILMDAMICWYCLTLWHGDKCSAIIETLRELLRTVLSNTLWYIDTCYNADYADRHSELIDIMILKDTVMYIVNKSSQT
jgi:hypothetical protein